jgi:hypothetical protein
VSIRRWVFAGIAIVLACEPGSGSHVRHGLGRGRSAMDRWISDAGAPVVSATTAISLGYIERLRLGLGSPFRLAEQALEDPRLTISNREDVAWAILARTLDRNAYHVQSTALDGLTEPGQVVAGSGAPHLALIDRIIRDAGDPRIGEAAIRIAYSRAAATGIADSDAEPIAARVAALIRDRELARSDVLLLLDTAERSNVDPLVLLTAWRAHRRFMVEAPTLSGLSAESGQKALAAANNISRQLRRIASGARPVPTAGDVPLLNRAAARVLAFAVDSLNPSPQAPVAVIVAASGKDLVPLDLDPRTRTALERFTQNAVSEEAFAAEYPGLVRNAPPITAARIALSVAVALRGYAQEPVWFPGFPAPTADQLEAEWGLEIRFAADLPASWRSYSLHMIDLALADMRRALPALDVSGLTIFFPSGEIGPGVLALHDPRRRRLTLPPRTGAGTLAHEIGHDLDWQVALRRYGVRGDYASDGAALAAGDPLGLRLADLAQAPVAEAACTSGDGFPDRPTSTSSRGPSRVYPDHSRRPTEIFARSIEWLVASTLAEQGRSNGYLTSIQDDVLTGYGSARPPDRNGIAGAALVNVLDEVAPLDSIDRDRFLARYGHRQLLAPYRQASLGLAHGADCSI